MKLIFALLIIFSNPSNAEKKAAATNLIPVELYWDSQAEASTYEIEILSKNMELIKSVKSPVPGFKFNMKPGKYLIRSRAADKKQLWSDWSEPEPLLVIPPAPKLNSPPAVTAKKEKGSITGNINLTWDPILSADKYKFIIKDETGKIIKSEILKESKSEIQLPPGKYSYEISAVTKDGWTSEPLKSVTPIEISSVSAKEPEVKLDPINHRKIQVQTDAETQVHLEVEYSPHLVENWKKIETGFVIGKSEILFDPKIIPGKYRYTLWTSKQGWIDSEKIQSEFTIKPIESDLIQL